MKSPATFEAAVERYLGRCGWVGDCLLVRDDGRYGEVQWGAKSDRGRMGAHRAVYAAMVGPIGADEVVRHRCDNPPCVNPAHLEAGTQADNIRDLYGRGRQHDRFRSGKTHPSAVLNQELVGELRSLAGSALSIRQIAKDFGITYSSARNAIRGTTWAHVTDPAPLPNVRKGSPSPKRRLSARADECSRAITLARNGHSLDLIAAELGVSRHTAFKLTHALEAS